jgi:hypothetical protein
MQQLDGAIRSTTPPRRRATRLPEPCPWKADAAIAPVASVAAFLIFTSRACGRAWRQALAGSTLRSSARRRRGPLRSRGTVAEVCPRSGSIRSSIHLAERQLRSARERRASRPVASVRPCLGHSRSRLSRCLASLRPRRAASVPGAAQEHIHPHAIDARNCRSAPHSARDKWLPTRTPPT